MSNVMSITGPMGSCKDNLKYFSYKVFAERLRADGFSDYKGDLLSWYRVVNRSVLQAVYIHADLYNRFCFSAYMGFGAHYLYAMPPMPCPPKCHNTFQFDPETFQRIVATSHDRKNFINTYPGTNVRFNSESPDGLEHYEMLSPFFAEYQTEARCYEMHKEKALAKFEFGKKYAEEHSNESIAAYHLSGTFVDEAIYYNDSELLPQFVRTLELKIPEFTHLLGTDRGRTKDFPTEIERAKAQLAAIRDGNREPWWALMEARRKKLVHRLERDVDIHI